MHPVRPVSLVAAVGMLTLLSVDGAEGLASWHEEGRLTRRSWFVVY